MQDTQRQGGKKKKASFDTQSSQSKMQANKTWQQKETKLI